MNAYQGKLYGGAAGPPRPPVRRRCAIEYRINPAARKPKDPTKTWIKKPVLSVESSGGIKARMIAKAVVRNPKPFQNKLPAIPPGTGIAPAWRAIITRSLSAEANI